jgi:hypothetical protein
MNFLVKLLAGAVFAGIDAFIGWIWLHDQFQSLSYWDFLGIALFGTALMMSAIALNDLRD